MKTMLRLIFIYVKHPVSWIVTGIVFFVAYNKLSASAEPVSDLSKKDRSSINFVNGLYKVDTTVIRDDLNKKRLVAEIERQVHEQKKTIKEVPDFIWRFLEAISYNGKFEIVNAGEEWKAGITDFGHTTFVKVFDAVKNDSVLYLQGDGAVLPDKQLIYFGMNDSTALMSYYQGAGLPKIVIFKLRGKRITDFWYGTQGFDESVADKISILKCLKSKKRNGC